MSSINLVNETLKATPTQGEIEFNGQFHATDNNSSRAQMQRLVLEAAKTASGTAVDFTGVPPWVKRITVMFNGVSLTGTVDIQVQLGVSGSYSATYASTCAAVGAAGSTAISASTTGFIIRSAGGTSITSGVMTICLISTNTWVASFSGKQSGTAVQVGGGDVSLSGTVTSLRITGAANTFDEGTINILYEG